MKNLKQEKLFNFKNKIVLITGSVGQLGTSFTKLFLSRGAIVVGLDNTQSKFKNDKFYFYSVDISKKEIVEKNIINIINKFKKIDVIINNAGYSVFTKFDKRTNEELDKTINVNIKGTLNIINSYIKIHKNKKLSKSNIINIGSIYGSISPDFRIYGKNDNFNSEIYGATKASIIQLTKYYSVILSKLNINVNCLSPGGIYNSKKPQSHSFLKKYKTKVPMNSIAQSEDLHTGILFLASDKSQYINGQNIIIDGGLSVW